MSAIGSLMSSTLVMAEADNFMKTAQAKMSVGKTQNPLQNQNNLKDVSIFSMKKPEA